MIVTLVTSTPPVPAALMLKPIALSSLPDAVPVVTIGVSGTAFTVTSMLPNVLALSDTLPNVSVEVLFTPSVNVPL